MPATADVPGWFMAVVVPAAGAAGWLLRHARAAHKDSVAEYQQIADRQQKDIDRLQSQVDEQQRVINRIAAQNVDCREESAEQYALLTVQHGLLRRWRLLLTKANIEVEDVPDLPPRRQRAAEGEADFLRRQTDQNTGLLSKGPPP